MFCLDMHPSEWMKKNMFIPLSSIMWGIKLHVFVLKLDDIRPGHNSLAPTNQYLWKHQPDHTSMRLRPQSGRLVSSAATACFSLRRHSRPLRFCHFCWLEASCSWNWCMQNWCHVTGLGWGGDVNVHVNLRHMHNWRHVTGLGWGWGC